MRKPGYVLAAIAATVGFTGLALFQIALAAGASWGHAAWGGASADLSTAQRVGSAISVLVYVLAIGVVLGRARLWRVSGHDIFFRRTTWALAGFLALGAVANFASESRWENVVMGPLALVLALLCVVVARTPTDELSSTTRDPQTAQRRGRIGTRRSRDRAISSRLGARSVEKG